VWILPDRQSSEFPRPECGKAGILVQDIDLAETRFPQLLALKQDRPGRIFMIDIGEYVVAVLLALEGSKVIAVPLPHDELHSLYFMRHQIEDPKRAAWAQPPVELPEKGRPFAL
jgi:hypothetical protein